MIIRATLPGNERVLPLEVEGSPVDLIPRRYGHDVRLKLRFTFPWEREGEIRKRGLQTFVGYDEAKREKIVVAHAEVSAESCEILQTTLDELNELRKYTETKNSKELWFDKELADLKEKTRG